MEVISVPHRSREEMLHQIFMSGNCLASPGVSMSREKFDKILYPLRNCLSLLQDVEMHIKLLLCGEIMLLDDVLVRYRFDSRTNNISAHTDLNMERKELEIYKVMDAFLDIKNILEERQGEQLLREIFKNEIKTYKINPNMKDLEYFLGRMALLSSTYIRQVWGYHKIMESFKDDWGAQRLKEVYGFEFKDYLELVKMSIVNSQQIKFFKKYKKYKKYTRLLICINIILLIIVFGLLVWK